MARASYKLVKEEHIYTSHLIIFDDLLYVTDFF